MKNQQEIRTLKTIRSLSLPGFLAICIWLTGPSIAQDTHDEDAHGADEYAAAEVGHVGEGEEELGGEGARFRHGAGR